MSGTAAESGEYGSWDWWRGPNATPYWTVPTATVPWIPFDLTARLDRIEAALMDLSGMQETIEILQQPEVARAITRARKRMEKGKNWREVMPDNEG